MKSERERQIPYNITYRWNIKYGTRELIYETETDSQTQRKDFWLSRGRDGRGMDWEFGTSRYKLLYIEWITKLLLCSTENYTQCPVINHNGKEYKNIYIYV